MRVIDLTLQDGVYSAAGPEREVPPQRQKPRPRAKPVRQSPPKNPLDEFFEGVHLGQQVLDDFLRRF